MSRGPIRRRICAAGATVYVSGRTGAEGTSAARLPGSVPTTAADVTRLGGVGIAAPCDAGDDRQLVDLIDRVREEQGRLDVLVNSAWGGYERFTGRHHCPWAASSRRSRPIRR